MTGLTKTLNSRDIRRPLNVALATAGLMLAFAGDAAAQAKKIGQVTDKTLTAADRWPIAITYYESTDGKDSPVAILLHMRTGNRNVWKGYAKDLQNKGFAVVAVDLRKHGDSKPEGAKAAGKGRGAKLLARDYKAMALYDLEAVKTFIYEEHQKKKLNMRKTVVVAPGFSAPVALAWAYADLMKKPHPDGPVGARTPRGQDVRAIVLISPEKSVPGIPSKRFAFNLSRTSNRLNIPVRFLVMWGKNDVVDRGRGAKEIYNSLKTITGNVEGKRLYEASYNTKARGTDLIGRRFGNVIVGNVVSGFLTTYGKNLKDPWVNRESKLTRKLGGN